jgi:hypothetical protein
MLCEQRCELGEQRDLSERGARFRRHPVRGPAGAGAGELVADVDHGRREVNVRPAEREDFGEAHAGVDGGCQQRPVADRAGREQTAELVLGEDSLLTRPGVGSFVRFESA